MVSASRLFPYGRQDGVYLEVEMPMWGADAKPEMRHVMISSARTQSYTQRIWESSSFLLYCNGNELEGDFDFLNELTEYGRSHDNRRLFSGSTARKHVKAEQFYVSHRSDKGGVTIYEGRPMTDWDINAGHGTGQPIISHETGSVVYILILERFQLIQALWKHVTWNVIVIHWLLTEWSILPRISSGVGTTDPD